MNLSEKIKSYRIENNLTQKELGDMLKVSRTLIADIERGRIKGTLKFATTLAEITNKPLNYWLDTNEVEKNYNHYEALDILIDSLIDTGMINEDGKMDEAAQKLIINVLEKEIALKIKNKK